MDVKVDMDLAAAQISDRVTRPGRGRIRWGLGAPRPQSRTPFGVKVTCGGEEGELALYARGWADILYWGGDGATEVVDEMVGDYDSPLTQEDYTRVLEAFGGRFRGPGGGLPK